MGPDGVSVWEVPRRDAADVAIVNVRANSPTKVGPQCATVSASATPGMDAGSSPTLDSPIELRSNGEGVVVEIPFSRIADRAGARYRSIVAALICCNCATACRVANGFSRSPAASISGMALRHR